MQNSKILALLIFLAAFGCKNETKAPQAPAAPKPEAAPTPDMSTAAAYTVTEGTVFWTGTKANDSQHTGTIAVSGGELSVASDMLVSGKATIDMKSVAVTDLTGTDKTDLEDHLKNSDFFEISKYPTAEFAISDVMPNKSIPDYPWVVSGALTMKGKSQDVNVPAKITISGGVLTAETPSFVINRTQWGINYKSGIIGTVKDKLIKDDVILVLKLKAAKK